MAVPGGTDYSDSFADDPLGVDLPLEPGTLVGEFVVEAQIGRGGFGTVYRARHPIIGKRAAIKVLSDDVGASQNAVARFIQEARAVNEIQHPNIVDIFSFGQLPDKRHCFAMELLEGQPFDAFLNRRDPLSVRELVAILDPVVRALDAAHAKGIVHRDLKPENIFLCFRDGRLDKVKLLDFGIAKLSTEALQNQPNQPRTRTGNPIGTPAFMSPEQCLGAPVSAATDVYALGVICYVALTGEPPFYSDSIVNLLALHINAAPPPMSALHHDVPKALDAVVLRMMAKQPSDRYASAGEALDALVSAADSVGCEADRRAQVTITEQPSQPRAARRNASTRVGAGTGEPVTRDGSSDGDAVRRRPDARMVVGGAALLLGAVLATTIIRLRDSKDPVPASPPVSSMGAPLAPVTSEPAAPIVGAPLVDTHADAGTTKAGASVEAKASTRPAAIKPPSVPAVATGVATAEPPAAPRKTGPGGLFEPPPSP